MAPDVVDFLISEGFLFFTSPDRSWPGDVTMVTADHMNVELADDVADGGDVHFVHAEGGFDPGGKLPGVETNFAIEFGGKLVEFGDFRFDFRDQQQPEEMGIVFQQHTACAQSAQREGRTGKAGIEFKGHGWRTIAGKSMN